MGRDKNSDTLSQKLWIFSTLTKMRLPLIFLILLSSPFFTLAEEGQQAVDDLPVVEDTVVHSVLVESCSGWRLNKLPEVKAFITSDLETLYERAVYKKVPGKSPEAAFLNKAGEEVERVVMTGMTRVELNALMVAKGIPLKPAVVKEEEEEGHDEM